MSIGRKTWGLGLVTTRYVATPENVAKKTLPENAANFVEGYIFGEPHTQKCSRAEKCS